MDEKRIREFNIELNELLKSYGYVLKINQNIVIAEDPEAFLRKRLPNNKSKKVTNKKKK